MKLPHAVFDGDDYFWIEKFDKQREPRQRLALLKEDLSKQEKWILTGAICGWGEELRNCFDLVVFLAVPPETRLQRLREREYQRYGRDSLPGGSKFEQSKAFLEWAALYDEAGMNVRSRVLHERWMSELACPILRIEGEHTVEERVNRVLGELIT